MGKILHHPNMVTLVQKMLQFNLVKTPNMSKEYLQWEIDKFYISDYLTSIFMTKNYELKNISTFVMNT
jgi:hypothetical protein